MGEDFSPKPKAKTPKTAISRHTWLIVGFVTFALLLMAFLGSLFQRSITIGNVDGHTLPAALPEDSAVEDLSHPVVAVDVSAIGVPKKRKKDSTDIGHVKARARKHKRATSLMPKPVLMMGPRMSSIRNKDTFTKTKLLGSHRANSTTRSTSLPVTVSEVHRLATSKKSTSLSSTRRSSNVTRTNTTVTLILGPMNRRRIITLGARISTARMRPEFAKVGNIKSLWNDEDDAVSSTRPTSNGKTKGGISVGRGPLPVSAPRKRRKKMKQTTKSTMASKANRTSGQTATRNGKVGNVPSAENSRDRKTTTHFIGKKRRKVTKKLTTRHTLKNRVKTITRKGGIAESTSTLPKPTSPSGIHVKGTSSKAVESFKGSKREELMNRDSSQGAEGTQVTLNEIGVQDISSTSRKMGSRTRNSIIARKTSTERSWSTLSSFETTETKYGVVTPTDAVARRLVGENRIGQPEAETFSANSTSTPFSRITPPVETNAGEVTVIEAAVTTTPSMEKSPRKKYEPILPIDDVETTAFEEVIVTSNATISEIAGTLTRTETFLSEKTTPSALHLPPLEMSSTTATDTSRTTLRPTAFESTLEPLTESSASLSQPTLRWRKTRRENRSDETTEQSTKQPSALDTPSSVVPKEENATKSPGFSSISEGGPVTTVQDNSVRKMLEEEIKKLYTSLKKRATSYAPEKATKKGSTKPAKRGVHIHQLTKRPTQMVSTTAVPPSAKDTNSYHTTTVLLEVMFNNFTTSTSRLSKYTGDVQEIEVGRVPVPEGTTTSVLNMSATSVTAIASPSTVSTVASTMESLFLARNLTKSKELSVKRTQSSRKTSTQFLTETSATFLTETSTQFPTETSTPFLTETETETPTTVQLSAAPTKAATTASMSRTSRATVKTPRTTETSTSSTLMETTKDTTPGNRDMPVEEILPEGPYTLEDDDVAVTSSRDQVMEVTEPTWMPHYMMKDEEWMPKVTMKKVTKARKMLTTTTTGTPSTTSSAVTTVTTLEPPVKTSTPSSSTRTIKSSVATSTYSTVTRTVAPSDFSETKVSTRVEDSAVQGAISTVCMYHSSHSGWTTRSRTYDLESFPYKYCTTVVYCCVHFQNELQMERGEKQKVNDFKTLLRMKKSYRAMKTFAALGGRKTDSHSFELIVNNDSNRDSFGHHAQSWLRARGLDGLYIYWTYPTVSEKFLLVRRTAQLLAQLRSTSLTGGIILPVEDNHLQGFDVPGLLETMAAAGSSILLAPPEFSDEMYSKRLLHRPEALAQRYIDFLDSTHTDGTQRYPLCPLFPLSGSSFLMRAGIVGDQIVLRPSGRGSPRGVSGEPGKLSYCEVCEIQKTATRVTVISDNNMMVDNEYLVYTTPTSLVNLLVSTGRHRPWTCLGTWGPEWDDFAGACGNGTYPLLRTLYEYSMHATKYNLAT